MYFKNAVLQIDPQEKIILGVSGGVDSSVLLHYLWSHGYKNIIVAHLNHGLRNEAFDDERFVLEKSINYGYHYECKSENVKLYAAKKKISIEEAGRKLRYSFFKNLCEKYKATTIMTAHTADDHVETMHMNILRGCGVRGLCGILPISQLSNDIGLARPLCRVFKDEIYTYVKIHRIKYREDASNENISFLRNRLRKMIEIKSFENAHYKKNFLDISRQALTLEKKIQRDFLQSCPEIHAFTPYIQLRMLEVFIQKEIKDTSFRLTQSEFFEISKLLSTQKNTEVLLRKSIHIFKEYGKLNIFTDFKKIDSYEYRWDAKETLEIPETHHRITSTAWKPAEILSNRRDENRAFIDKTKLKLPLTVRNFRKADRFQPLGMRNFKKIHDFFIDKKVPKRIRYRQPIIVDNDGEVIWICGYAVSEKVKISRNSTYCAQFVLTNLIQ